MDFNPHLGPERRPAANERAGKGSIEQPDRVENIVWQTRAAPHGDYENRLGDALEAAFEAGVEDLERLIDKLNELGARAPDGDAWTADRFEAEMARLGD